MKNTWKWVIGGGAVAVIIVVAVVFANPNLQKGFFKPSAQLSPGARSGISRSRAPITNIPSPIGNITKPVVIPGGLRNCNIQNDVYVSVHYSRDREPGGPVQAVGFFDHYQEAGKSLLAVFSIQPRNCTLGLDDLDITWENTYNPRNPQKRVIVKDPTIRIFRGDTFVKRMLPRLACLVDPNLGTFYRYDAGGPVIQLNPYNSYTFGVTGTPFAWIPNRAYGDNVDINYKLHLAKVNNSVINDESNYAYLHFGRNEPVRDELVDQCARR